MNHNMRIRCVDENMTKNEAYLTVRLSSLRHNSVFFSPSYYYGNSRPADTPVLAVYITGPV